MAKRRQDNDEQPDENQGKADDSADNFGLPDIEYKPLDREEEVTTPEEPEPEPEVFAAEENVAASDEELTDEVHEEGDEEEEGGGSNAPVIISIIIVLVVIAAGFLLYSYVYKPKKEKERLEQIQLAEEAKKKAAADSIALVNAEELRKKEAANAAANAKPSVGSIETLSARTGRFYVVVTSDIDGDLVMDFANKLSPKGVSSKIIPPYGKYKYFRLTIGDFDTYAAAQSSADASKAEYGNGLWVIKY